MYPHKALGLFRLYDVLRKVQKKNIVLASRDGQHADDVLFEERVLLNDNVYNFIVEQSTVRFDFENGATLRQKIHEYLGGLENESLSPEQADLYEAAIEQIK